MSEEINLSDPYVESIYAAPPSIKEQSLQVLNHWNTRANIGVKHTRPEAKIYANSLAMIDLLLRGTFARLWKMDVDFLEDYNLYDEELNKPLTVEELCLAIDKHDHKCKTADPYILPRSFTDFCFNPRTRYSFLFSVIGDRTLQGFPQSPICQYIHDLYIRRLDLYRENMEELTRSVNFICKAYDKMADLNSPRYESDRNSFHEAFIRYVWVAWRDREYFTATLLVKALSQFPEYLKREEPYLHKYYYKNEALEI